MPGDDVETPFSRDRGNIRRLLHQWGTSTLGASLFLPVISSFLMFVVIITNSLFLVLCSKETA